MKKILICSNANFFKNTIIKKNYYFLNNKSKLDLNFLEKLKPDIIFFPHWNYHINSKIISNFNCIGFHSTPLPYGRGGSPIQNMIIRGYLKTQVCSFKINEEIDSGPIYTRKNVSLVGSGQEIYIRIYNSIIKTIYQIEKKIPSAIKQKGKATYFKRRELKDGNLIKSKNLKDAYNLIRMLDIEFLNYPKAFIAGEKIKFEFQKAKMNKNSVEAFVKILRK